MPRPNIALPLGMEALEPRALFSALLFNSPGDFYNVGAAVLELGAPEGSVGFGASVVGLGDVNADGFDDFAVSAPGDTSGDFNVAPGSVYIFSGQGGSVLATLADGAGGFGISMANVGDLNSDGVDDLLVGSPWKDTVSDAVHDPTGVAYVYSGADGSIIFSLAGTVVFGEFGRTVAAAHDIDDDATRDMLVAAPGAGAGVVLALSGADFSVIRTFEGETPGERFGSAIGASTIEHAEAMAPRIFIGAPMWNNATGRVYAFLDDGGLAHTLSGVEAGEEFGASLALAWRQGLVLFVGAPGADDMREQTLGAVDDRGRVDQFATSQTTASNQFLGRLRGERLGDWISNVGSVAGSDSSDDLAVGTPGDAHHPAKYIVSASGVWSLRTGPGAGLYLDTADIFTGAIAPAGDVNNDGFADIVSSTTAAGGRVTIVNALALGDAFVVRLASPDLSHVWTGVNGASMLGINGTLVPAARVPGLPQFANIQALFNDGAIVYYTGSGPVHSELTVLRNGVGTALSALVTTVVGGETPAYDRFSVAAFNDSGDLALIDDAGRAWVYQDGTLTYIWHGTIADMNAGGAVVGYDADTPSIWRPVGGVAAIEGLERVGAINDMGEVLGVIPGTRTNDNPGTLGLWREGSVTEFSTGPTVPNSTGEVHWVIRDLGSDGRALADADVAQVRTSIHLRYTFAFDPEAGLLPLTAAYGLPEADWSNTYSWDPFNPFVPFAALGAEGTFVAQQAFFTTIDETMTFTLREGTPVANVEHDGESHIVGVNLFGDVMSLWRADGVWTGRRLQSGFGPSHAHALVAGVAQGEDGGPFVVVADYEADLIYLSLLVYRLGDTTGLQTSGSVRGLFDEDPITAGLSLFTNSSGVAHIAGTSAAGDVVLYYQIPGQSWLSPNGWAYANLSAEHLGTQSMATPRFVGAFSSFGTSWDAMHINGLDDQGHAHSVWWAPGQTFWSIADISSIPENTGPLHGQLTSFATAWGTLHLNALDQQGELVSLWWAPGFGGAWRRDALVAGGIALAPDSLVSYTTPWGGLNVAGRDAQSGEVVVYWWSPESAVWTDEPLTLRDDAASPPLTGRLSASVSDDGTMGIAGRAADGHATRFSWRPGDAGAWTLEDATALAQ